MSTSDRRHIWSRRIAGATRNPFVAGTLSSLLVLVIGSLIPRARHFLSRSDEIPRIVWIIGLIVLLATVAALVNRARGHDQCPARARRLARLARGFRDHFLTLFTWEIDVLYDYREGNARPDDESQRRYRHLREPLLRTHDEVGPDLRHWLDHVAEPRYDLSDPLPVEWDPGMVLEEPLDGPLTAFFNAPSLEEVLRAASDWETEELTRRVERYRETLDAFVRWAERGND